MSEAKKWQYTVSKNGRHQISEVRGGNVCMIWNCKDKERNANLIAASPEMYELLEFISENPSETNVIEIRRLLAKARGEQDEN